MDRSDAVWLLGRIAYRGPSQPVFGLSRRSRDNGVHDPAPARFLPPCATGSEHAAGYQPGGKPGTSRYVRTRGRLAAHRQHIGRGTRADRGRLPTDRHGWRRSWKTATSPPTLLPSIAFFLSAYP